MTDKDSLELTIMIGALFKECPSAKILVSKLYEEIERCHTELAAANAEVAALRKQ